MKILHVISTLNPTYGGPVEGLKEMAAELKLLGHCVDVVTMDNHNAPWLKDFPINVFALGPKFFKYSFCFKLIVWLLKNSKFYDVLIVNGIWQFHSLASYIASKFTLKPYFLYTHGMLDPWFKKAYPLKHLKKYFYWLFFEYRVLKNSRAVIFTSEEERSLARLSFQPYKAREAVINFGIIGFKGCKQDLKNLFYEKFPELLTKRCILFVSRIHQKKGCDLLIRSFSEICFSADSFHLVIVGNDQDGWRAKLEKLAINLGVNNKITWTGMVSNDLKWGALNSCEVFMLPSHSENFGSAVVEALSCSLPVLISNKVNIWREIELFGAGIVSDDSLVGSNCMLNNWTNLSDLDKINMRNQALNCFNERFNIKSAAINLSNFLESELNPSFNTPCPE
jgi:glycosyltransferase involved in cell wall biosynthesis